MKDPKKEIHSAIEQREFSIADLRRQIIDNSTRDLSGSGHRMEHVATVNGIEFINDSGATSASLAWFSLERIEGEAIWIVGSLQEGQDYSDLKEVVRGKVKGIVCLGRESSKVYKTFMASTEVIVGASTAEEAVRAALALAKPGQKVILSPACPSHDLFESYEDRGNQFVKAVLKLVNG